MINPEDSFYRFNSHLRLFIKIPAENRQFIVSVRSSQAEEDLVYWIRRIMSTKDEDAMINKIKIKGYDVILGKFEGEYRSSFRNDDEVEVEIRYVNKIGSNNLDDCVYYYMNY